MKLNKSKRLLSLGMAALLQIASGSVTWTGVATAKSGEVYALRGGTIVTVTGEVIPKGTIVIRDGLIESVGSEVKVPGDARVIDVTGLTIYPGLFDSYTNLGLTPPPAPSTGAGGPGQGRAFQLSPQSPAESGLLPEIDVVPLLQTNTATFEAQRAAGITTALTGPRNGVFQGRSALINLGVDSPDKLIIRSPYSLNVGFSSARGGYPNSLMGVFAFLRQSLLDANHYREEWTRYNQTPRGASRPGINKSLEALQPVIKGELPVIFNVNTVREMKRAIALAEEFNLKYLLNGGLQSYQIADFLKSKNATLLLSLSFPQRPAGLEDAESESIQTLRERAAAPGAAAALHRAGVRFAFTSGGLSRPADYVVNAQRAIQAGLPKEAALKALTIDAAVIFGVDQQLGSIEKGKIANLVLTTGDIFAPATIVRHVFIDGKKFDIKAPENPRGNGPAGRAGGRGASDAATQASEPATGVWSIMLQAPGNDVAGTLTLQQTGDSVSGEVSTPFGVARITQGRLAGTELILHYTLNFQGQELAIEARGRIEGNSIRGTLNTNGQSYGFSGTRRPNLESK